jgi:hypothetical protein
MRSVQTIEKLFSGFFSPWPQVAKKERAGDFSPARSSGVFGFFILRFVPAPGKR